MKNKKGIFALTTALVLSLGLVGCSSNQEEKAEPKAKAAEQSKQKEETKTTSEKANTEKTNTEATTGKETNPTQTASAAEPKETFTLSRDQIKEQALQVIKADYDKFFEGKDARTQLLAGYNKVFAAKDKEYAKLISTFEGAIGKSVDSYQWKVGDVSKLQMYDFKDNAYKGVYQVSGPVTVNSTDGSVAVLDNRVYFVKEYDNKVQIIYISANKDTLVK